MAEFINKKTGQPVDLNALASDVRRAGSSPNRLSEFKQPTAMEKWMNAPRENPWQTMYKAGVFKGHKPKVDDVKSAIKGGHISKEEGVELNPSIVRKPAKTSKPKEDK